MTKLIMLADAASPHTQKWANYFQQKGYKVIILSLLAANIPYVDVVVLNSKTYANRKDNLTYNRLKVLIEVVPEIRKLVKSYQPDILHSHFASSYGLFGALAGFQPYFVSIWGYDVDVFPNKSFIHKIMLKYVLKKARTIFATSKYLIKVTKKYTTKKVIETSFGIDLKKFYPIKIDHSEFNLVIAKQLRMNYGFETILKAMNLLVDKIPELRLMIAGSSEEKFVIEELLNELNLTKRVKFLGRISQREIVQLYAKADIAVYPSLKFESFGVSVLEAQACGVPVIVSDVGGLPEVIRDEETGYIIKSGDYHELAEKILYLYENKDIRIKMHDATRKFVRSFYQWQENAEVMEDVYQKFLN